MTKTTLRAGLGALALLAVLGGCGKDKDHSVSVSIGDKDDAAAKASAASATSSTTTTTTTATSDGKGNVSVSSSDGSGNVKIDAPGFKLDVDVPKSLIDNTNFDLDGVKLYPGSRMRAMTVNAGKGSARVHIRFLSPADPATVRGYLMGRFADRGRVVTANGMTLSGKTDEGKPFTIVLTPSAGGHTSGDIEIVDPKSGASWSTD